MGFNHPHHPVYGASGSLQSPSGTSRLESPPHALAMGSCPLLPRGRCGPGHLVSSRAVGPWWWARVMPGRLRVPESLRGAAGTAQSHRRVQLALCRAWTQAHRSRQAGKGPGWPMWGWAAQEPGCRATWVIPGPPQPLPPQKHKNSEN